MIKDKFLSYKPSSSIKGRICLPERIFNYFCPDERLNYAPFE
ncbi:hypothetical protein [Oceanirhabdus sp. W0125-5]|nr:hypothetical protein [Oceanirhabdus sp. W0125-5]WBW96299.1 hypothetical protein OW730_21780 [Oceanirhabdus sp. W0125-5]